jgi:hypothetical protein
MHASVGPVASRSDMNAFIRFPLQLYRHDPLFVPHLLYERKKFFHPSSPHFTFTQVDYFLARNEQGRVVGRITAHVNRRHNEYTGEQTGFFGFFECVQDQDVAAALLAAAENSLRNHGMKLMRGPFNFSTNQECGLLVQGFDRPPALMMPYTQRYYPDLLTATGYRQAKDLLAYEYGYQGSMPEFLVKFSRRIRERKQITVRPIRRDRFEEDLAAVFAIYNAAWADNWGFVPVTEAEFRYTAKELKPIVDPAVTLIAEKAAKPVAFSVSLPDYNPVLKKMHGRLFPFGLFHWLFGRRKIHKLRTLLLGVVEEHRHSGIEVLLIHDTFVNGIARGYRSSELSWILEDNVRMRRPLERMGAQVEKVYRIFEKSL